MKDARLIGVAKYLNVKPEDISCSGDRFFLWLFGYLKGPWATRATELLSKPSAPGERLKWANPQRVRAGSEEWEQAVAAKMAITATNHYRAKRNRDAEELGWQAMRAANCSVPRDAAITLYSEARRVLSSPEESEAGK